MIYLDNAATSWPKPAKVYESMDRFMRKIGANPGRGGHSFSVESGRLVLRTREKLSKLINAYDSRQVIFTLNATDSLNMTIKGLVKDGDHVVTTKMEHNSMIRPINRLAQNGIEVDVLECDETGVLDLDELKGKLRPNTRLVAVNHASNVLGTIQPLDEIGKIVKDHDYSKLLVDAAQTIGIIPIDVVDSEIDFLAFPGHKGLMGPQGTGGLYIRPGEILNFWREGGTGSKSESILHPEELPDRLESGTPNTPGIAGLEAGLEYLMDKGIENILNKKQKLTEELIEGLLRIDHVQVYGPLDSKKISPVVSFNIGGENSQEISFILDQAFGVASRGGLHCAPMVHENLGTLDQGAVRFSIGDFNNQEEIETAISAVKKIAEEKD